MLSLSRVNTHTHKHTHTHTGEVHERSLSQSRTHTVTYILSLFFPLFLSVHIHSEGVHTHSGRRAGISLTPAATRQCKRYACCTHDCARGTHVVCVCVCMWVVGREGGWVCEIHKHMHADVHECTRRSTGSRRSDCRRPKRPKPWTIGS